MAYGEDKWKEEYKKQWEGGLANKFPEIAVKHHPDLTKDQVTDKTSLCVHWLTGEDIATVFGLPKKATMASTNVQKPEEVKKKIESGDLIVNGLYLFVLTKGKNGHIGFCAPKNDGSINQWQYSETTSGFTKKEFGSYLSSSKYKTEDTTVSFYLLWKP